VARRRWSSSVSVTSRPPRRRKAPTRARTTDGYPGSGIIRRPPLGRHPSSIPHGARPLSDPASTPPPRPTPPPPSDRTRPPGLREQFGATRDAAIGLVTAHVELAKAELAVIGGELGKLVGLVLVAIVLVLFAVTLIVIGGSLFLAETLFGSMGWGILHGVLFFVGLAIAGVLVALGVSTSRLAKAGLVAILVGIVAAVVFATDLFNRAYTAVGDLTTLAVEPGVRPLVIGVLIWAGIGLLVGIGMAFKVSGAGARVGALLGLTVLGALIGAFTALTFGVQVGIALGIAFAYATWIALMLLDVSRTGIDTEALQQRFLPTMTIETSKETLEWLRQRMPGSGS
jgi:hypothetical protein